MKDGKLTTEVPTVHRAIKALRECYAALPAKPFSALKLKAVRDRFVAASLARQTVNRLDRRSDLRLWRRERACPCRCLALSQERAPSPARPICG